MPGERYRLAFRARAGAPRTMEALLAQDRPPWAGMGFYRKIPIAPDWAEVAEEFVISGSDRTAGISFNIGGEEPAVELADVVLTRLSTKEAVVPPVERRYMVQYAFNDHSCRGRDYVIPKPRNAVRILVLGASHTLGSGVHERDVFSTRLEEILNDTPPAGDARRYEVINCGMNAFSPREERQMYRRTADYTPDIVLLMVTENDDRSPQDEKIRRSPDELASKLETIFYSWYVFNSMRGFGMARDYTANARELVALHAEVTRDGAVFVPLLFRYAASGAGGVYSAFSAALAATGTRLFDLGDAIVRGHQWSELIVHPIDPHPNEIAHRAAAAETARLLRLQRLLPDAPIPRAIQKP